MVANKELPSCPVETTLALIGNKWKVLILRDLMPGAKRFGELQRSIGRVSQKVLTSKFKRNGIGWISESKGVCRSAATRRIQPYRTGAKFKTHFGLRVGLG